MPHPCKLKCVFYTTVAPYNVHITGDNMCNRGDHLELKCSSDGGPNFEYSWSRNGENGLSSDIIGTTNTLVIPNITTADGGDYSCTVTNDAGSSKDIMTIYGVFIIYIHATLHTNRHTHIMHKYINFT